MSTLATPQPLRMSWEEFLEWTDDECNRGEWVDGEVIVMSPNSAPHQRLVMFLGALLQLWVENHDLGEVLIAPFLIRLTKSGREPDVLFLSHETRKRIVRGVYLQGPADLAVEIVSRDSRTRDRRDKLREYEENGVREYWLIDPERQQATFYTLEETGRYAELPIGDSGAGGKPIGMAGATPRMSVLDRRGG